MLKARVTTCSAAEIVSCPNDELGGGAVTSSDELKFGLAGELKRGAAPCPAGKLAMNVESCKASGTCSAGELEWATISSLAGKL
jgi:hypothetical protein